MKLDSPIFDRIRVKPERKPRRRRRIAAANGRAVPALASIARQRGAATKGQYFHYCREHVRMYNQQYNYFRGMSDEEIASFQQSAMTGHRPTWNIGTGKNGNGGKRRTGAAFAYAFDVSDPLGVFGEGDPRGKDRQAAAAAAQCRAQVASDAWLESDASASDIRSPVQEPGDDAASRPEWRRSQQ